jgi:AcrR family transcriptional regulator
MGKLINRERRARAKEAKQRRMQAIREEAVRAFVKLPYVEITLDSIGSNAGVKKGVASMYFGSKEELFLELLRAQLDAWYGELEQRLAAPRARLAASGMARLVATSLAARPVLARLLSLEAVVLEQNVEIVEAYRFHRWQFERMAEIGALLERRSRSLERGEGLHILHLVQLITGGLQPMAEPRGSLAVNLHDPDFAELRIDLERELAEVLERLLGRHEAG